MAFGVQVRIDLERGVSEELARGGVLALLKDTPLEPYLPATPEELSALVPDGQKWLTLPLLLPDGADLRSLLGEAWTTERLEGRTLADVPVAAIDVRSNPPIAPFDVWNPEAGDPVVLGTSKDAEKMLDVQALHNAGAKGEGVNVVLIDSGTNRARMERLGCAPVGGWARYAVLPSGAKHYFLPGEIGVEESAHAMMLARAIKAIAPDVTFWDVPLLPDYGNAPPRLNVAEALLWRIRTGIKKGKFAKVKANGDPDGEFHVPEGPWVLVNAWGVMNTRPDRPHLVDPWGDHSDNPAGFFNTRMPKAASEGIDVVFAAGNCGAPTRLPRCGEFDSGPGRSLHGANAHPSVLSVGAVQVDGRPVWLSAQGPGRLARPGKKPTSGRSPYVLPDFSGNILAQQKPDLCAPSHFRDAADGRFLYTGTSAACAVAAGVLAALRSVEVTAAAEARKRDFVLTPLSPHAMRVLLRKSCTQAPGQSGWDPRLGHGVINPMAALALLKDRLTLGPPYPPIP